MSRSEWSSESRRTTRTANRHLRDGRGLCNPSHDTSTFKNISMKASSTALSRLLQSQASTSRSTITLSSSKPLLRPPPPPSQRLAAVCRPPLAARSFHSSAPAAHGGIHRPEKGTGIKVTFRDSKGADIKTVEANEGDDLLSVAHEYDVDLEGESPHAQAPSTGHQY